MNKQKNLNDYKADRELNCNQLIDDFSPYISTIINNMVGDNLSNEDKEEILLDVFLVLWKNRFNSIDKLDSYIAGITRNLIRDKFKKKKITYNIEDFENVFSYNDFEIYSEDINKIEKIEKELKKLKKTDIDIITMFYYDSMSLKEISKKLKTSEFNIANKLSRIRKKVKKSLNRRENG